jgi:hypothetical protein
MKKWTFCPCFVGVEAEFFKTLFNIEAEFFKTLFSPGYFRCAWDRCKAKWSVRIGFSRRSVEEGERARDATLLTTSGETRSLISDYVNNCLLGQPLVLNFGSYT